MRIAIVRTGNGSLNIRNYNIQEIGLGKSLLKLGISVDLYSTYVDVNEMQVYKEIDEFKLRLIPINGLSYKQVTFYPKLITKILDQNYDVVQVHEDSQLMNAFILSAVKKQGAKTILYQGMYNDYDGLGFIYQKVLEYFCLNKIKRNTDFFLSKTETAKNYLFDKRIDNVITLPVGLDFKDDGIKNRVDSSLLCFREKYKTLFLYVGVFEKRRNIFLLLEVLLDLINSNVSCGLVLVGKGPNKDRVLSYIEKNNLSEYIFYLESMPNDKIGELYKICDMFWLPSYYEIYGMVLLEAIYYGIPVVSSYTAGSEELIKEDYLGKLVSMIKEDWVCVIKSYLTSKYMDESYKLLRKTHVYDNYNWDIIAEKYKLIISSNENTLYK